MNDLLKKHLSNDLYNFWENLPQNDIQKKGLVGFVKEFHGLTSIEKGLNNSNYTWISDRSNGIDGCVLGPDNRRYRLENKGCSSKIELVKSKQLTNNPELIGCSFFKADIHRQGRSGAPDRAYTCDEVDVFVVVRDDKTIMFDASDLTHEDGITLPKSVWIFLDPNVRSVVVPSRGNKLVANKGLLFQAPNETVQAFDYFTHNKIRSPVK